MRILLALFGILSISLTASAASITAGGVRWRVPSCQLNVDRNLLEGSKWREPTLRELRNKGYSLSPLGMLVNSGAPLYEISEKGTGYKPNLSAGMLFLSVQGSVFAGTTPRTRVTLGVYAERIDLEGNSEGYFTDIATSDYSRLLDVSSDIKIIDVSKIPNCVND